MYTEKLHLNIEMMTAKRPFSTNEREEDIYVYFIAETHVYHVSALENNSVHNNEFH